MKQKRKLPQLYTKDEAYKIIDSTETIIHRVKLQDIFNAHGNEYLTRNPSPPHVHKAVRAIQNCRTAALGAHVDACECGYTKISYNSCRNRHCPKCQALSKERWLMARESELLPVSYFHVVFTLPQELHEMALHNREEIFSLLFKASAETLKALGKDPKHLGAELGFSSILHTWGQNLMFHPYVHIIVPGGGLTTAGKWHSCGSKFFIPVKAMAKLFRGKFLGALKGMRHDLIGTDNYDDWQKLLNTLYSKDWYVYCKRPFKTSNSVLQYLERYTHRIAISNHRIIDIQDNKVSFLWRDYKDDNKQKVMTLTADEFIRRFLLHILPPKFTKIRHYGFLASFVKTKKLGLCRELLNIAPQVAAIIISTVELIEKLTGVDITVCPKCGLSLSRASPYGVTA